MFETVIKLNYYFGKIDLKRAKYRQKHNTFKKKTKKTYVISW